MITPSDFADWYKYAGLVSPNLTVTQQLNQLEKLISPAGLAVIAARDFQQNFPGTVSLNPWLNFSGYDLKGVRHLSAALRAIGATRTAEQVEKGSSRSALDEMMTLVRDPNQLMEQLSSGLAGDMIAQSMARLTAAGAMFGHAPPAGSAPNPNPDMETRDELELLLAAFVAAHQSDLNADIAKHGDVRTTSGFNAEQREAELESRWERERALGSQQDAVDDIGSRIKRLEKELAKGAKASLARLFQLRSDLLEETARFEALSKSDLIPAMRDRLEGVRALLTEHAPAFAFTLTDDATILSRLAGLGESAVMPGSDGIVIEWKSPQGFDCDWTRFSLTGSIPVKSKSRDQELAHLLDSCELLRGEFDQQAESLRRQVIEHFTAVADQLHDRELEDFARDANGEITDASILEQAGAGELHLEVQGSGRKSTVRRAAYFRVAWDAEHGFEIDLDEDE